MSDDLIERLWPNGFGPKNLEEVAIFIEEERKCEAEYRAAKDTAISEMRAELERTRVELGETQLVLATTEINCEAELSRLRKALEPFSRKERWFKTYHRPEVPGPELPVVFFSDNPWESNDLEPWVAAARALSQDEPADLGVGG